MKRQGEKPMATFVIGYDIHPTKNETYDELIKAIKKLGSWWHNLDSTWVVVSDSTASQIRDELKKHMYKDDQLLVVKSANVGSWFGFSESGSQWLKDHL
jgi:iron-sulfur cluster repair protein YtfE (RIC family)